MSSSTSVRRRHRRHSTLKRRLNHDDASITLVALTSLVPSRAPSISSERLVGARKTPLVFSYRSVNPFGAPDRVAHWRVFFGFETAGHVSSATRKGTLLEFRFDTPRRASDARKHAPLGGIKCTKIIYIIDDARWGDDGRVDARDGAIVCGSIGRYRYWPAESQSIDVDDDDDDATDDGVGRDAGRGEKGFS